MKREAATKIAEETQNSYNNMAKEFSDSRVRFWDELAYLAEHIVYDDRVLDIGCGNGRFSPLVLERQALYEGIDYSEGLINEARKKFPELSFCVGNATALPYEDGSFDIAFSFAVVHHIPSTLLRKRFILEALRVLRPGGKFIITAWDIWAPRYYASILSHSLLSVFRKNTLDFADTLLTFGKQKHPRYVHAFTVRELHKLLTKGGFTIIGEEVVARKSGQKNIIVIAQKN